MSARLFAIPDKHPTDRRQVAFGFANYLAESETISSKAMTVPAAIVDGAGSSIVGSDVLLWVTGGVAGATYRIVCTITTSAGRIEAMEADLRVVQP